MVCAILWHHGYSARASVLYVNHSNIYRKYRSHIAQNERYFWALRLWCYAPGVFSDACVAKLEAVQEVQGIFTSTLVFAVGESANLFAPVLALY